MNKDLNTSKIKYWNKCKQFEPAYFGVRIIKCSLWKSKGLYTIIILIFWSRILTKWLEWFLSPRYYTTSH